MQAHHILLLFLVLSCSGQLVDGAVIIDGNEAPANSMMYMVSVQKNGQHICGGFLITEEYVITAAHCEVNNPTTVVVGTHNLQKKDIILTVVEKYKHPSFENVGKGNDIMLLKLSSKVPLGNGVQIIQLPHSDINIKENEICQVAGWGKTTTTGSVVDKLRVVDVSVISHQLCEELWPGLSVNVICAGGYKTTKGFCQGDSGGPLVCSGMAVGVVSFNRHANCAYPDIPNVYTDISKYLAWIDGILLRKKDKQ